MSENTKWIVALFVSLLGIIVPIIMFGVTKEKKSLCYEVIAGAIISEKDVIKTDDVDVVYKNEKLKNLNFDLLKFTNNGNVPIKKSDFDKSLKITYPVETRLISARLWKQRPQNLEVNLEISGNQILVQPLLINVDEYFIIQTLTSNKQSEPNIDARILGLREIDRVKQHEQQRELYHYGILMASLASGFIYGAIAFFITRRERVYISKFLALLIVISTGFGGAVLNSKFIGFKELGRFSWPAILLVLAVAVGFWFSRFRVYHGGMSNHRVVR